DPADLADGLGRVGVEAELRRQVERDRQPGLPFGEEVTEALVGLARRAEAGVLPHRPQLAAVHRRVDAAREGELAGAADILRHRRRLVERLDDRPASGGAAHAPSRSRLAMTSYWISLVPSKMRKTRASRQKRWAGNSREYPYPPKTCMASLVTCSTISAQNALAMPASRSQRLPVSFMRAAW